MWRLFRLYKSGDKDKVKSAVKDASEISIVLEMNPTAISTCLVEADEEENLKRDVLSVLNELADLHERIKR